MPQKSRVLVRIKKKLFKRGGGELWDLVSLKNYTMQIRPLSLALRLKAEEELHETPSFIATNIKILRKWMKQQPHLRSIQPTDQWLIAFLRGCKHNIEKCKGKIETYYTLKGNAAEFFENRDPFDKNIQDMLKVGVFLPLKKCSRDDSPRTCLARIGPYSASGLSLTDYIKVSFMIVEILLLEDDNFSVAGEEIVVDFNDFKLSFIWQWTPALARKCTTYSEKALSVRLKGLHLLDPPFGIGGALTILKMFLAPKIKNRIVSHSKDSLLTAFDKSMLPEEYGGTDGNTQELIDYWKAKVESYRDWFLDETTYADESKRPVTKRTGFFGWL